MASLEPSVIVIKIRIGSAKLEKLLELMPDHEKDGQNTTPIYWAIDETIRATLAKSQQEPRPNHGSNRDYLRRG
jgi:hypothetical protein